MRTLISVLALTAIVGAAAPLRAQALIVDAIRPDLVDSTKTTVLVDNERFDEATVYVVLGGTPLELGVAHSMSKTRFTIPKSEMRQRSTLRFVIRPIGNPSVFTSRDITVEPGDRVSLTIPTI